MPFGFVTCGPNEALVISGCFYNAPLMIPGGRAFVWPTIQKAERISLNVMTLIIESPRIYTQLGVPITVTGVAQVKIQGSNQQMLASACEQFLGKSQIEIQDIAKETLEGHQRAIMGNMTVEEIYKDRQKFSQAVFDVASSDLVNMGISVVSYTLKDIKDEQGYLHSLGMARTAQVKRDARIGEAEAQMESGIKAAIAEQERQQAKLINDAEIAEAKRDFEIKKASYDKEVLSNKAKSDMAYETQAAKTKQLIVEEEMQIKVVERMKQISVEELEIQKARKRLMATVNKKAEAEKFQMEKIAEATKIKIIAEAQAEAETIRLKGIAEAESQRAKALAEAEQMEKKAEAWNQYLGAAKLEMVLKSLPKISAEVSAPLAACNKITMVSTGDGEVGISKVTNELLEIIEKLPKTIESLTGIDVFATDNKANK